MLRARESVPLLHMGRGQALGYGWVCTWGTCFQTNLNGEGERTDLESGVEAYLQTGQRDHVTYCHAGSSEGDHVLYGSEVAEGWGQLSRSVLTLCSKTHLQPLAAPTSVSCSSESFFPL